MVGMQRLFRVSLSLVLGISLIIPMLNAASVSADDCTSNKLALSYLGPGGDITAVCLQNVNVSPDGTLNADIVMRMNKAIPYSIRFAQAGGATMPYTTSSGTQADLIAVSSQAQAKGIIGVPLLGKSTKTWHAIFPPGSQVTVSMKKWGDSASETVSLVGLQLASSVAQHYGGVDVGQAVNGDPGAWSDFTSKFLDALGVVHFNLDDFSAKIRTGNPQDVASAFTDLTQAISASASLFAPIFGIGADIVAGIADFVASFIGGVLDIGPVLFDYATAPTDGGVQLQSVVSSTSGQTGQGPTTPPNISCFNCGAQPTVSRPSAPTGLRVAAVGTSQLNITWSPYTGAADSIYLSDGTHTLGPFTPDSTSAQFNGLPPGTYLCLQIYAHNGAGDSDRSAYICATTGTQGTASQPSNTGTVSPSWENGNQPTTARYVGTWKNVDAQTRDLPEVQIAVNGQQINIHVWGACSPTWCDWGSTTAISNGSSLTAVYDQGFADKQLQLTIDASGRLVVTTHVHFKDNSGRSDLDMRDIFTK